MYSSDAVRLLSLARAVPDGTREQHVGCVAELGVKALPALIRLRDDPDMVRFAIAVLERLGKADTTDAILVLRDWSANLGDSATRSQAKDSWRRCLNPLPPAGPTWFSSSARRR